MKKYANISFPVCIIVLLCFSLGIMGYAAHKNTRGSVNTKSTVTFQVPEKYEPPMSSDVRAECIGDLLFYITKSYASITQVYDSNASGFFIVKCDAIK